MITISFQNSGGELDRRQVEAEADVKAALIELIDGVAYFSAGDRIVITDDQQ